MKKRLSNLLMILLIAAVAATVLTACAGKDKPKEYDHLVTFDYNVGNWVTVCETQYLGVLDGKKVAIKPGDHSKLPAFEIEGYYLEGWYTAKVDSDGNPIVDQNNFVKLAKAWDFEKDMVSSDITLYANWVKNRSLRFVDSETKNVIGEDSRYPGYRKSKPSSVLAPTKEGYTLYGYYDDEDCTQEFKWPYVYADEDKDVYVKFIKGVDWKIVKTAKDLKDYLVGNNNVYLDCDIDLSQVSVDALTHRNWTPVSFGGVLNGNNHTISGIVATCNGLKDNSGTFAATDSGSTLDCCAVFRELGSTAEIKNVKFENINLTFEVKLDRKDFAVALFAYKALKGAKLENVTVSGTLSYKKGVNELSKLAVNPWIGSDATEEEDVKACDYSGVVLKNLDENN